MEFLIAGVLFLSACASAVPRSQEFQEDELRPYATQGTAAVHGTVLTRGGGFRENETHVGSEIEVQLTPVNSFTTEWYREAFLKDRELSPAEPRLDRYVRRVKTNEKGEFTFSDLPPGDYYLTSIFHYETEDNWTTERYDTEIEESRVSARVRITEGDLLRGVEVTDIKTATSGPDSTTAGAAR